MLSRLRPLLLTIMLIAVMGGAPAAHADTNVSFSVHDIEPFVFVHDGDFTGFTVDVINEIAKRNHWHATYIPVDTVPQQLDLVRKGQVDGAAGALSITEERSREFDFSQPTTNSGLQIITPTGEFKPAVPDLRDFLSILFSRSMLLWVITALVLAVIPAHIIWLLERRNENSMLPHDYLHGVPQAFAWSLQTVVGIIPDYPRRNIVRVFSIAWGFVSIIFVAYYIATLTSNLTVERFDAAIIGPSDLFGKRVCTASDTTSSMFLKSYGVPYTGKPRIEDCYAAMNEGRYDAVVFDAPVVQYYVSHDGQGRAEIAGPIFKEEDYGVAFRQNDDAIRKDFDATLLAMREDGTYGQIRDKWFKSSNATHDKPH